MLKECLKTKKEIYYITGESKLKLSLVHTWRDLKEKGFEVLYCIDPVDEWVMQAMTKYDDKQFVPSLKKVLTLIVRTIKNVAKRSVRLRKVTLSH